MRRFVLALALLATAGCAGDDDDAVPEPEPVGIEAVTCDDTEIRIEFDPRNDVIVTAGDRTLATAAFRTRTLADDCEPAGDEPLDAEGAGETVYEAVAVRCTLPRGAYVRVSPVVDEVDEVVGSNLVVGVPPEPVAAAVLKNEADPQASRMFFASRFCTREVDR